MFEGNDELERGLRLRALDAATGLHLGGVQPVEEGKLLGGLSAGRSAALARVQGQHDPACGVHLVRDQFRAGGGPGPQDVDLGDGLAFDDPNAQGVRQDALDRGKLHDRDEFQVAFHTRQVERQQVLLEPDAGPATELVGRNDAVRLHVQFL